LISQTKILGSSNKFTFAEMSLLFFGDSKHKKTSERNEANISQIKKTWKIDQSSNFSTKIDYLVVLIHHFTNITSNLFTSNLLSVTIELNLSRKKTMKMTNF